MALVQLVTGNVLVAVECFPALHYCIYFNFVSFGIMDSIVKL